MNLKAEELVSGSTLLIDKPVDWTSFDVVNKIKYSLRNSFNLKKIKVGHAGTLDPFATGLLVVCTGKNTKKIDTIVDEKKEYIATFEFGIATDSQDSTGNIIEKKELDIAITRENIKKMIEENFIGEIEQIPPMFSAIKVDGQRLYKKARKGIEVERKSRKVTIYEYKILSFEKPFLDVRIVCSKGTYIRTLADDLGKKLNNFAYCKNLRRTKIGNFEVSDAFDVLELSEKIKSMVL